MSEETFGGENTSVATSIVSKYIKGMQTGRCDSIIDYDLNYISSINIVKVTKPKALWPQLIQKEKEPRINSCESDFKKKPYKDFADYSFYITSKTNWKIIEKRSGSNGKYFEIFVKLNYPEDDAPAIISEPMSDQEEFSLLKSCIYEIILLREYGKILISNIKVVDESKEFYSIGPQSD
jgi:hypothetical protein